MTRLIKSLSILLICCLPVFAYATLLEVNEQEQEQIKDQMLLTEKGLGNLTAATPFNVTTIQALFPDYQVKMSKGASEGIEYKTMVISKNNEALVTLLPTDDKKTADKVLCLAYT